MRVDVDHRCASAIQRARFLAESGSSRTTTPVPASAAATALAAAAPWATCAPYVYVSAVVVNFPTASTGALVARVSTGRSPTPSRLYTSPPRHSSAASSSPARFAASATSCDFSAAAAAATALPPTTTARLWYVPQPSATKLVLPWRTVIHPNGIASSSARICARTVSWPWPEEAQPL